MRFSIKHVFSKCDEIHSFLRIGSHLLEKSLMENFISSTFRQNTQFWGDLATFTEKIRNGSGTLFVQ